MYLYIMDTWAPNIQKGSDVQTDRCNNDRIPIRPHMVVAKNYRTPIFGHSDDVIYLDYYYIPIK